MGRVAIVIWTDNGQTLKIAHHMLGSFDRSSIPAQLVNLKHGVRSDFDLKAYDHFIIGSDLSGGKFPPAFVKWVATHSHLLNQGRTALFSVSLTAASSNWQTREKDQSVLREFVRQMRLKPHFVATFAGAVHYRKYGPIKRYYMQQVSKAKGCPTDISRDHELTKWSEISALVDAMKWTT